MTTTTTDRAPAAVEAAACAVCLGESGEHVVKQENLDCPDCLSRTGLHSKMGNKRSECKRCNRFAQRLIRASARRLQSEHLSHYEALRNEAEVELYIEETS